MARTQTFSNGELGLNVRNSINSVIDWNFQYVYNSKDMTFYNGGVYASLIDNNIGNIPSQNTSSWQNLFFSGSFPYSASYSTTSSYALNGGFTLTTGSNYPITSSWSNNSKTASVYLGTISTASYSTTASYALNAGSGGTTLVTGSTYQITSSWANNTISASFAPSISASYAISSSFAPQITQISASWASSSLNAISSSYSLNSSHAISASYAPFTQSIQISASWASSSLNSISASYAPFSQSYQVSSSYSVSASYAPSSPSISASYAATASFTINGGTSLTTGSTYNITSSWSNNTISASYAPQVSFPTTIASATQSLYATQSLFSTSSLTASFVNASNVFGNIISSSYSLSASYAPSTTIPNSVAFATQSLYATNSISASYFSNGGATIDGSGIANFNTAGARSFAAAQSLSGPVLIATSITGSVTGSLNGVASYALSASYATNSGTASLLLGTIQSASYANSASYAPSSPSISASYAFSASYAPGNPTVSASYSNAATFAASSSYISGSFIKVIGNNGTFVATPDYTASNANTLVQILQGSAATPVASADAVLMVQKISNVTVAGAFNPCIYGASTMISASTANNSTTAVFGDGVMSAPGLNTFVEGVRGDAILTNNPQGNGQANGGVFAATCAVSSSYQYLIGSEAEAYNASGINPGTTLNKSRFSTAYLATSRSPGGNDAGFMTNPNNTQPVVYGFLAAENSVANYAFASRASTQYGLDLSQGTQSLGAILLPNLTPIRIKSFANGQNLNVIYADSNNFLIIGADTSASLVSNKLGINIGNFSPQGTLHVGGNITASSVTASVLGTSSYAISASYAPSSPSISASYALSASYATNSGTTLTSGSIYNITSSWSNNTISASYSPSISSSYSLTSSYSLNGGNNGTQLTTGSTYPITSSWSNNTISASYAPSSPSISASYALTASYAFNGGGSGSPLTTGSTYPITSSWANNTVSASYAPSSPSISSSYSLSSSYAGTASILLGSIQSASYATTSSYAISAISASYAPLTSNVISANTTFYVSPTGNDSNTGATGSQWLTIQHAVNSVGNYFINSGVTVTIQLAAGSYTGAVNLVPITGGGSATILGNTSTPGNYLINGGANTAIYNNNMSSWTLSGVLIESISGSGVTADSGLIIIGSGVNFGGCAAHQILAQNGGIVRITTGYGISGGAIYHISAMWSGMVEMPYQGTITITNTPSYSAFAHATACSSIFAWSLTFISSSVSGPRYSVALNSTIDTNQAGATYFPGNSPGTTGTNGLYN